LLDYSQYLLDCASKNAKSYVISLIL
jgi:hypothetical protein